MENEKNILSKDFTSIVDSSSVVPTQSQKFYPELDNFATKQSYMELDSRINELSNDFFELKNIKVNPDMWEDPDFYLSVQEVSERVYEKTNSGECNFISTIAAAPDANDFSLFKTNDEGAFLCSKLLDAIKSPELSNSLVLKETAENLSKAYAFDLYKTNSDFRLLIENSFRAVCNGQGVVITKENFFNLFVYSFFSYSNVPCPDIAVDLLANVGLKIEPMVVISEIDSEIINSEEAKKFTSDCDDEIKDAKKKADLEIDKIGDDLKKNQANFTKIILKASQFVFSHKMLIGSALGVAICYSIIPETPCDQLQLQTILKLGNGSIRATDLLTFIPEKFSSAISSAEGVQFVENSATIIKKTDNLTYAKNFAAGQVFFFVFKQVSSFIRKSFGPLFDAYRRG